MKLIGNIFSSLNQWVVFFILKMRGLVFELKDVVAHFGENIGVKFGVIDGTEHYYFTFLQFPSSFTT